MKAATLESLMELTKRIDRYKRQAAMAGKKFDLAAEVDDKEAMDAARLESHTILDSLFDANVELVKLKNDSEASLMDMLKKLNQG